MAGFAPAWGGLRDRCLSRSSHIGTSRSAQIRTVSSGFGDRLLSQEHTPKTKVPGGNRTRRLDGHNVVCQPLHHEHNASARIRTWTACLEDRHDVRFITEAVPRPGIEPGTPRSKRGMMSVSPSGHKRKARELNPHLLLWENRLSRAARPTVSGYLPLVDRRGFEPRSPACKAGIVPVGPAAHTDPGWTRTIVTWL